MLCRSYGETTKEHAPPRVAFPSPRPSNCITVPTCRICNGGMSDLDEDFGNFMGFLAAEASPEGAKLWEDRLVGIKRNKRKFREILENITSNPQVTMDGTSSGKRSLISFSPRRFEPIYDKCFRALYYTKYERIYPVDLTFEYFYPRDLTGMHSIFLEHLFTRNIGADHVFYRGVARTDEDQNVFAALLVFYGRFAVVGMTADLESFRTAVTKKGDQGADGDAEEAV